MYFTVNYLQNDYKNTKKNINDILYMINIMSTNYWYD